MSLIEVRGLNKSFAGRRSRSRHGNRVYAVKDVEFTVEEGETLAIIGESGAGKSTTARLLNRLIEPDSGSVKVLGTEVMDLSAKQLRRFRSNMQMVFQDAYSSLDPRLTIADSVAEPMLVHGSLTRAEQRQRSADLLERVGLEASFLDRRPRELSGGQLQRIAIARALSVRPKVIICDEPVSALDVSIRAQVLNLLLSLKQEFAVTYLVITHDLALIPVIADHVLVMRAGEVVERGTSTEVMLRPQHPYTKELLGSIPSLVPKALRPDRASHAAVTAPPPSLDPPSAPQSPPHPAHDSTGEADR